MFILVVQLCKKLNIRFFYHILLLYCYSDINISISQALIQLLMDDASPVF